VPPQLLVTKRTSPKRALGEGGPGGVREHGIEVGRGANTPGGGAKLATNETELEASTDRRELELVQGLQGVGVATQHEQGVDAATSRFVGERAPGKAREVLVQRDQSGRAVSVLPKIDEGPPEERRLLAERARRRESRRGSEAFLAGRRRGTRGERSRWLVPRPRRWQRAERKRSAHVWQ
jgi:hypothetical protein